MQSLVATEECVHSFINKINKEKAIYDDRMKVLVKEKSRLLHIESNIDLFSKTASFLNRFSSELREQISKEIENLVTRVLRKVLGTEKYSFKIQFQVKRGTTEAVFLLWDNENKHDIDIINSSGGGVADIISTILFFAFLQIKNDGSDFLLFDEVGKNISADKREMFFGLLKELIDTYNKQIIYVSHQEELISVADNVILLELDKNGYVKIGNKNES